MLYICWIVSAHWKKRKNHECVFFEKKRKKNTLGENKTFTAISHFFPKNERTRRACYKNNIFVGFRFIFSVKRGFYFRQKIRPIFDIPTFLPERVFGQLSSLAHLLITYFGNGPKKSEIFLLIRPFTPLKSWLYILSIFVPNKTVEKMCVFREIVRV